MKVKVNVIERVGNGVYKCSIDGKEIEVSLYTNDDIPYLLPNGAIETLNSVGIYVDTTELIERYTQDQKAEKEERERQRQEAIRLRQARELREKEEKYNEVRKNIAAPLADKGHIVELEEFSDFAERSDRIPYIYITKAVVINNVRVLVKFCFEEKWGSKKPAYVLYRVKSTVYIPETFDVEILKHISSIGNLDGHYYPSIHPNEGRGVSTAKGLQKKVNELVDLMQRDIDYNVQVYERKQKTANLAENICKEIGKEYTLNDNKATININGRNVTVGINSDGSISVKCTVENVEEFKKVFNV